MTVSNGQQGDQQGQSQDGQQQGAASAGAQQGADTSAQQQGQQAQQPEPVPYARFKEVNEELAALKRKEAQAERERQAAADAAATEQGKFRELAEQRAAKLAETETALRKERTATAILRAATEAQFPVDVAERMVDVEYDASGAITTDIPAAIKALAAKYPQLVAGKDGQQPRPGNGGGPRPAGDNNGLAPQAVRDDLAKSGRYGL